MLWYPKLRKPLNDSLIQFTVKEPKLLLNHLQILESMVNGIPSSARIFAISKPSFGKTWPTIHRYWLRIMLYLRYSSSLAFQVRQATLFNHACMSGFPKFGLETPCGEKRDAEIIRRDYFQISRKYLYGIVPCRNLRNGTNVTTRNLYVWKSKFYKIQ